MTKIKREATIEIAASVEDVWKILADEFTEVSNWVESVITSEPNPTTPDGLNGSKYGGRICDVQGLGKTTEALTAYDDAKHSLTYAVEAANFPEFLAKLENSWSVEPSSDGRSNVTTSLMVEVAGDGSTGSPQVQFAEQIAGNVGSAGEQLKSYAESR